MSGNGDGRRAETLAIANVNAPAMYLKEEGGYVREQPAHLEPDDERMVAIRAASIELYGAYGYGPFGAWGLTGGLVVPQLTLRTKTPQTAAQMIRSNPVMFSPMWRIALRVGALPLKVYDINPASGERDEATDHPAYGLLRKPNNVLTRNLLIGGSVLAMLWFGKCGWVKTRPGKGKPPVELWPIPGNAFFPARDPRKLVDHFQVRVGGFSPVDVAFEDVCYFRLLPDPDDWAAGLSPVESLGPVGDYSKGAMEAATEFWEQGLLERLWIDMHGKELTPPARRRLQANVEIARRDRYGIPVMEDGATLEKAGSPPTPDSLNTALEKGSKMVKEALGMPETTQGERATGTEIMRAFYAEVVQPIADAIEQELERSLMPEWPDQPAFPEFAFREVLKGTPAERIQSHQQAILSGQETPNEARKDENKPPMPGGDQLMVPLNVVPIAGAPVGGTPRQSDTAGGLGGQEGKGTLPNGQASDVQPVAVGAAKALAQQMRRRLPRTTARAKQTMQVRWGLIRKTTLASQSAAAGRRMRGVLKKELKDLKALAKGLPGRAGEVSLPPMNELLAIINQYSPDLGDVLRGFMDNTGEDAYFAAEELIGAQRSAVNQALANAYAKRAQAVEDRFGQQRLDTLSRLLEQGIEFGWRGTDLASAIATEWGGLADYYIDGIARTETAWAYEQASTSAWRDGGVEVVEFVFGGGPCTTGVCEDAESASADAGGFPLGSPVDNVGFSFEDADGPPLHPNCDCYMVAALDAEAQDVAAEAVGASA